MRKVGKKESLPAILNLRFESLYEGLANQIMHLCPYSAEGSTIVRLHKFIGEDGHQLREERHDIYLTGLQKSTPEKIKTAIRQQARESLV